MKRLVTILKIILVISFFLVMVPNEFFVAPVFLWIVAILFDMGSLPEMLFSLAILITATYLIITSGRVNKLNDWLCLIAISIFNFPIALTIRDVFAHPYFISRFSYLIFIVLSFITILITVRKLILDNYQ